MPEQRQNPLEPSGQTGRFLDNPGRVRRVTRTEDGVFIEMDYGLTAHIIATNPEEPSPDDDRAKVIGKLKDPDFINEQVARLRRR